MCGDIVGDIRMTYQSQIEASTVMNRIKSPYAGNYLSDDLRRCVCGFFVEQPPAQIIYSCKGIPQRPFVDKVQEYS